MYGSDNDPAFNDPKTHEYRNCFCMNQEPHCWYCGCTKKDHIKAVLAADKLTEGK